MAFNNTYSNNVTLSVSTLNNSSIDKTRISNKSINTKKLDQLSTTYNQTSSRYYKNSINQSHDTISSMSSKLPKIYQTKANSSNIKQNTNPDIELVDSLDFFDNNAISNTNALQEYLKSEEIFKKQNSILKSLDSSQATFQIKELQISKRKENLRKETEWSNKIEMLDNTILEKTEDREILIIKLCKLQNEIEQLKVDNDFKRLYVLKEKQDEINQLELVNNSPLHSHMDSPISIVKNSSRKETKKTKQVKKNMNENHVGEYSELDFTKRNLREKAILLADKDARDHNNDINKRKKEIEILRLKLKTTDQQLFNAKNQKEEIKNELFVYFQALLKNGKDYRDEGISWIIKRIWKLGFQFPINSMPDFLDESCIHYLIKYSKYELELDSIKKESEDIRKKFCAKRKYSIFNPSKKKHENRKWFFFKMQKKTALKMITEKHNHRDAVIDLKTVSDSLEQIEIDHSEMDSEIINRAEHLENKLKIIKQEMKDLRTNQFNRIDKEFRQNDYERRFNIDLKELILSLVGEKGIYEEILKINYSHHRYQEKLAKCKTYNTLESVVDKMLYRQNKKV